MRESVKKQLTRWLEKLHRSVWPPKVLLPPIGRYGTRFVVAIVWYGVLWTLLGDDALPRGYLERRRNETVPCRSDLVSPFIGGDQVNFPDTFFFSNDSMSSLDGEFFNVTASGSIVTSLQENGSDVVHVAAAYINVECPNILEVFGERGHINDTTGDYTQIANSTTQIDLFSLGGDTESSRSLLIIPNGHFFALSLLLIVSSILGFVARNIFLPPLFGMMMAGFILTNAPYIDFARDISPVWSSTIRNMALTIVLIRGGLSLNPSQLKRLKLAVLLLGSVPCICEGALDGMIATLWLKMPWQWAFTLGYVLAAISPAIVVPQILVLKNKNYGTDKGVATLIVAGASIDVVISISLFGIFLGLVFSEGSLILDIFRAPIQVVVGLLYGIIFGLLLWLLPTKHFKKGSMVRNRFLLLLGLGIVGLFGSLRVIIGGSSLAGAGALAVLVLAFVAGQGWTKESKALVSRVLLIVWQLALPLLFALIGAEMDIKLITPSLIIQGMGLIVSGLVLRVVLSFFVTFRNGFTLKEKLFIAVSWLPKATVQAAIGSIALDIANTRDDPDEQMLGRQVLTIAVLAIILTAPAGAIAISILGPVMLKKNTDTAGEEDSTREEEEGKEADAEAPPMSLPVANSSTHPITTPPSTPHTLSNHSNSVAVRVEEEEIIELRESPSHLRRRTENDFIVSDRGHMTYFHGKVEEEEERREEEEAAL